MVPGIAVGWLISTPSSGVSGEGLIVAVGGAKPLSAPTVNVVELELDR